jgi:predicted dehydrogenase
MASKVRIGFIGFGGIAGWHFNNFLKIREAKVTAACDPDPTRYKKFCERQPKAKGLAFYPDYKKMLKGEDLDAVDILGPHNVHYRQMVDAFAAGLHVLCEKPMVASSKHARDVIRRRDEAKKVLVVSYQRHYQGPYAAAKALIERGGLGNLEYIAASQHQEWLTGVRGTWRQDPKQSCGGQINDSGSHLIDIIQWMTGKRATDVYAKIDNLGTLVDIDSSITCSFTDGVIANIAIVGSSVGFGERIQIWGSKGWLAIDSAGFGPKASPLVVQTRRDKSPRPVKLPPNGTSQQDFIRAITRGAHPRSTAEGALNVILLSEAAWKSAGTGRPVKVQA